LLDLKVVKINSKIMTHSVSNFVFLRFQFLLFECLKLTKKNPPFTTANLDSKEMEKKFVSEDKKLW